MPRNNKLSFLERFEDNPADRLESDPELASIDFSKTSGSNEKVAFDVSLDSNTFNDQPYISKLRERFGEVEIEDFDTKPRRHAKCNNSAKNPAGLESSFDKARLPHYSHFRTDNGPSSPFEENPFLRPSRRSESKRNSQIPHRTSPKEHIAPEGRHGRHQKRVKAVEASSSRSSAQNAQPQSVIIAVTPAQRIEKHAKVDQVNALDDYELQEQVGRGAYGVVHKALNRKTNQFVAIKVMRSDEDEFESLMKEIDLLKILNHPNIVKYHGFVKTPNTLNVILEYCDGGSLRQLYKRLGHGLPEKQVITYARQILIGLEYLHKQGVVHRDVKAANVLLTESGEVKLADFGVATTVATLHNTLVGTPHWMAPETFLGGDGSCTASDIWSFGATIVELITTNPPNHHLSVMAAVAAKDLNEHPPLPPSLSVSGQNFLMECFQRTPALRKSATLLLQLRWLQDSVSKPVLKASSDSESSNQTFDGRQKPKYTRAELLSQFQEKDEDFGDLFESINSSDVYKDPLFNIRDEKANKEAPEESAKNFDEYDQFSRLDSCDFITKESEKESETALLLSKLAAKTPLCSLGSKDAFFTVTKITSRIYDLVRKYPTCVHVLSRDHGVINFMDLLAFASEYPAEEKLWLNTLGVLNCLLKRIPSQFDSFSTLGGIPKVIQFSQASYSRKVRLQVSNLVKLVSGSEVNLKMFIASGGLQILSRFLKEDVNKDPEFPIESVRCIYEILSKDLSCSKSDLCRTLSKYGIVSSFVCLLETLTSDDASCGKIKDLISENTLRSSVEMILNVIQTFGQAGAKVQVQISSPELFTTLIKVYKQLLFRHQMIILNFFRAISYLPEIVRQLAQANILQFYVDLLVKYPQGAHGFREVSNVLCPSIYQCCYLNHERQTELVRLGAVPYLRDLSKIELPTRQFILPIFFDFVNCNATVRQTLLSHDVPTTYLSFLRDPYWACTAIDSLYQWSCQDKSFNWLESQDSLVAMEKAFVLDRVLSMESFLTIFYRVMLHHIELVWFMTKDSILENIMTKLAKFNKSAAVKLTLLKILFAILTSNENRQILNQKTLIKTREVLYKIENTPGAAILASDLAHRIISIISKSCR